MRWRLAALIATVAVAPRVDGQGFRLRFDNRYQAVSFRGIEPDSILATAVIIQAGRGPMTPDGFAVRCPTDATYCFFFRPGPRQQGHPLTGRADVVLWGLGVRGLSVHANGRYASDLGSDAEWPGTSPSATLLEGYVQYQRDGLQARAGRQTVVGRLGYQGFDGVRLTLRPWTGTVEFGVFGGWGLARALAIPVTSPALNPLDDFQPRDRQLLVGAAAGVRTGWFDARADYRREVDPVPDYLVSERASISLGVAPATGWRLSGGAEYDLANGWWGTTDARLAFTRSGWYVSASARRYRPFFDLWTIWGAFNPVPHTTLAAAGALRVGGRLWIRARGERYWYDEDEADSPLVSAEDRGWRASLGATATIDSRWTAEAGLRSEFGPGASSYALDGGVTFRPRDGWYLAAKAGTVDRPLEFRFSESKLRWYSVTGDLRLTSQWRLVTDVSWFAEDRTRPDAAAFDFDQLRLSSRLVLTVGSGADRLPRALPRASGSPR